VVLMSSPRPHVDGNPYLELLCRALENVGVTPVYFSWRRAILGRYDVVHIHWPETLLRARGPIRTILKRALFAVFLVRLRVQRVPLVRTVHNREPHEAFSRAEAILARWLDQAVRRRIYMSGAIDKSGHLIRHGHYRDVYSRDTGTEPKDGRILYFGAIRRYKQVPQLCRAFAALTAPAATLRVVGEPASDQLRLDVERAAAADPRISVDLARMDPQRLAEEIHASQLVVLPFEDFGNSGSAVLALSLDRPILVPDSVSSRELRNEVGDGWVVTYRPPLTGHVIEEALAKVSARDAGARVTFVGRDWIDIVREHAVVYESARQTGRRGR
jgi:glycosyltransferase involved in cell wall biosynthesis